MKNLSVSGAFSRLFGVVLALLGIALTAGGATLAYYDGSPYYVITGVVLLFCSYLVFIGHSASWKLYFLLLALTVVWSIGETGFNAWALLPRLGLLTVLAVMFIFLPSVSEGNGYRRTRTTGLITAVILATLAGAGLHMASPDGRQNPVARAGTDMDYPSEKLPGMISERTDWAAFGNDKGGTRFSPLDQINTTNVSQLEVAWEADTGPASPGNHNDLEVVPLMVNDTVFVCNGHNRIFAYDAESGKEKWHRDISGGIPASGKPCRGVAYYKVSAGDEACAERIFANSQTPALVAMDARTGELCKNFGENGLVDLRKDISQHPPGFYYASSAPQVIRGKIVVGGSIIDGQSWGDPSGVIRAFDAVTGKLAWAFDSGRPDRTGAPPLREVYTPSTPNNWAPTSSDEQLGLVYLPIGGATPDNYGGQRRPGDDLIGSSVIALDAETGRLRWVFQTTHHDIWDYDVASQPTLTELSVNGQTRHVLIQPTKRGEIFILDRETGKPVFPVTELPVPQGNIAPGERLSATQPFSESLPAFRMPRMEEKDMWGITPVDQLLCRIAFRKSRYEGHFTPLTLNRPVIIAPGSAGGINWGGVSLDPDHGVMIVNWMRLADRVTLVTRNEADKEKFRLANGQNSGGYPDRPMLNTPYGSYGSQFLSALGVPCNAPPWGLISAVNLHTGKLIWSKPLGTGRDTGPLGIPTMLPLTIGVPMTGGSVTTRGGLVFIGAVAESTFRALDVRTGKELWSIRMPAAGNASPITYRGSRSGRQFVLIAAGGRKALKVRQSTKIVAYALPEMALHKQTALQR